MLRVPGRSKLFLCALHLVWGSLVHRRLFLFLWLFIGCRWMAAPFFSTQLEWSLYCLALMHEAFCWLPDWLGLERSSFSFPEFRTSSRLHGFLIFARFDALCALFTCMQSLAHARPVVCDAPKLSLLYGKFASGGMSPPIHHSLLVVLNDSVLREGPWLLHVLDPLSGSHFGFLFWTCEKEANTWHDLPDSPLPFAFQMHLS